MSGLILWTLTVVSIVGLTANVYKRRWGFYVLLGTNLSWAAYNVCRHDWEQAVVWAVYGVMAVWGIVKWMDKKENVT